VKEAASDPVAAGMMGLSTYLGHVGGDLVQLLMCSSIFAGILACHNILARYVYSLSVDGALPKCLASVHRKHGSPYWASCVVSLVSFVALLVAIVEKVQANIAYATLMGIAGYALLGLMFETSVAVVFYFGREKEARAISGLSRTIIAPILATGGLGITLILATRNIADLTGGSELLSYALLAVVYLALVGGAIYARVLKKNRPDVYRRIGRQLL